MNTEPTCTTWKEAVVDLTAARLEFRRAGDLKAEATKTYNAAGKAFWAAKKDIEILRLEERDAREDYDPIHAELLQASVDFDAAAADQKEATT